MNTATANRRATLLAYQVDEAEIRRAAAFGLFPDVFELRVLNCKLKGQWRDGTFSGYFERDAIGELIHAVQQIEFAPAVYFTPNPVKPELLTRADNKARLLKGRQPTTSDADIARRRWLLIDIDAVRPSDISATEAEKEATLRMATDIDHHLWEEGFPPGIIGDSGNGTHLMIPMDLPANDGGFCERLLKRLASDFDNKHAKVDQAVFNQARIWKLPGTMVCKGDHVPRLGRVWRMAKILTVCEHAET